MPFCLECGYKIPEQDPFCGKCGAAALPVTTSDNQVPACQVCGGRMRSGRLYSEQELTIVMSDTDEERFVEALTCATCGRIELVVDFETDVEP